ncbi:MAG: outer membrane lipoprotein-sorting protein [Deltaproteobacteria bacterium]|nr:outer membrane lipoprotein-sorting protein [Deltaproteobacteria bacterium]
MTHLSASTRPHRALPVLGMLAALVLSLPVDTALAQDGRAIMEKVNAREDGDNQTTRMEMVLIDAKNTQRVRSLQSYRKDKGKDTLSLMFFLAPADVEGTGFLSFDYDEPGKDDDQWLYLPALRKSKRIASGDKSGSFMGSDFNYADMTRPDLDDYTFTVQKEEEVDGHAAWRIESVPKTGAIAEETGYSKSVAWVRKDNYVLVRAIRWVNKSARMKFMQITKLEQIDGIWVAREMQMATKEGSRTVHTTVLRFNEVKFNQTLTEETFTLRRLEKGP